MFIVILLLVQIGEQEEEGNNDDVAQENNNYNNVVRRDDRRNEQEEEANVLQVEQDNETGSRGAVEVQNIFIHGSNNREEGGESVEMLEQADDGLVVNAQENDNSDNVQADQEDVPDIFIHNNVREVETASELQESNNETSEVNESGVRGVRRENDEQEEDMENISDIRNETDNTEVANVEGNTNNQDSESSNDESNSDLATQPDSRINTETSISNASSSSESVRVLNMPRVEGNLAAIETINEETVVEDTLVQGMPD